MKLRIRQHLICLAAASLVPGASAYEILVGPFQPGTGHYDLLPEGDFESSIDSWSLVSAPGLGQAHIASSHAANGRHSLEMTALQTFTGPGFALAAPQMTLSVGVSYTLSGFILTPRLPAHGATPYFDLDDSPGENWANGQTQWYGSGGVPAGGSLQWQFVWATYTPTETLQVVPRACVDVGDHTGAAYVDAGDVFYIDDMALTETSRFVPPVVVPEPGYPAVAVLGCASVLFALFNRKPPRG